MAITIENIIQSNLDLLNEQEQQLLELLGKISKAKSLFGGGLVKRRGRPARKVAVAIKKAIPVAKGSSKGRPKKEKSTYMQQITEVLNKNGKMKPAAIIKVVAQMRGKDVKKTGYSIYPLLGPAVKAKKLVRKGGWYSLK